MFGLNLPEFILLGIIALIFIGPEQLPQVARTIARLINELRRASTDIQSSLTDQLRDHSPQTFQPPPVIPPPATAHHEPSAEVVVPPDPVEKKS